MIKFVCRIQIFKLNHKINQPKQIINQNYTKNLLKVNVDITRNYSYYISSHKPGWDNYMPTQVILTPRSVILGCLPFKDLINILNHKYDKKEKEN